ncbi:head-to-tail adaptor [Arthrobacter phage Kumotta]|uniref:Head-to-tail adaptor n=1 Tax=Arthrobacter phage Kumotta TaxID=2588498 RepID=A0A4Y6EUC6_9CAUD|nr:head-to-tail adaptor [Arthrobacter phage Kumotta]QDF19519.1 head-to-tail adaptor [Arthrobacter phage Kumotta]
MVDRPLLDPTALNGFPGAPFTAGVAAAAAGQIRDECAWHIAPEITETVTIWTDRDAVALLPSLKVKEVLAVRDADGNAVDGWKVKSNGVLRRTSGCWPEEIEVEFTHGYETCPSGLVAVVAERARDIKSGRVKSESLAGRSVSLDTGAGDGSTNAIAKYALPGRP